MTSLVEVSFGDSTVPIEPPPSTSMPAFFARLGGVHDLLRLVARSGRCEPIFRSTEMNAVFLSLEICAPRPAG